MRITKRIVLAPSTANRIISNSMIVPEYPNLEYYADRIANALSRNAYNDIVFARNNKIPVQAYVNVILPLDIGYIFEHEDKTWAVPIKQLTYFMIQHECKVTDRIDRDSMWIECDGKHITYHNISPTIENRDVLLIYGIDTSVTEEVNVPINRTFLIITKHGTVEEIRPKGKGLIYGLKEEHPELLAVSKGKIIDVSGYTYDE